MSPNNSVYNLQMHHYPRIRGFFPVVTRHVTGVCFHETATDGADAARDFSLSQVVTCHVRQGGQSPRRIRARAHATSATLESPCEVALREYLKSASRIASVAASSLRSLSRRVSLRSRSRSDRRKSNPRRVASLLVSRVACEIKHVGRTDGLPASSSSSRSAGL